MSKITLFIGVLLFVVCSQSMASGLDTAIRGFNKNNSNVAVSDTVRGIVSDQTTGEALPGANVFIKGTQIGTATNVRGRYALAVSSLSDTLEVSYIGYKQKEIPINGRTMINIKLVSLTVEGNQLVVVGYGVQQAKDVTGSVGTVKMASVDNQPIVGANEALAGQVAGVQVNTTNGVPGGGPQVNIRGVGAIGAGNAPLYVVDGYPLPEGNFQQVSNPLNNIPPSDIASISVLKGPSATAIYGSRASNGVVLITTKQGKAGKLQFNVNAYTGWQSVPNQEVTPMMNAEQFATFEKQRFQDAGNPVPSIFQNPSQYAGKGTNWFKALTRVAPVQNVNFSASGGTNKITAYFSGSMLRQQGVVIASDYNRISFRANIAANISPKLKLGLNFAPNYSFGDNKTSGSVGRGYFAGGFQSNLGTQPGYFGEWYQLSPMYNIKNSDGSYIPIIGNIANGVFEIPNPVQALRQITYHKTSTDVIGNAYAQLELVKGLTFKSSLDMETSSTQQKAFTPSTVGRPFAPPPSIPSGSYGTNKFLNWNNDNTLTFNHSFSDGQTINLTADFSEQQQLEDNGLFNGTQYADNAIQTLNGAATITANPNYTYAQTWTLVSYLARLNYSYKDTYLLTVGARRDGSSRFGANNRWGTFPNAAIAWRLTNEPWMNNISWLSNLKLRASWGITGNNQIGNYPYASRLQPYNYVFNDNLAQGKTVQSMSNPNLAWERTNEVDLGLDAGFKDNRITVTADVYKQKTKDLLLNLQVPDASGFQNTLKNIGAVQNKGFELAVQTQNVVRSDFNWSSNFTFSLNRNKVLALGPDGAPIRSGTSGEGHPTNITEIGQPVGMFYGYKFLGLYTQAEINAGVAHIPGVTPVPGDMRSADINHDGVITPVSDFTIIGNPYPKFNYGITNTLNYKGLTLNFVFTGSYGADRMKANYETFHNIDGIFNLPLEYVNNRYRSPSNPGDGRHPTTNNPSAYRVMYRDVSSLNVFNASYLWCKNITLGYTLPRSITKGYFQSVFLYTSIQNAFIITPYPNGNPAVTAYTNSQSSGGANAQGYGTTLTPGIDWTAYPTPRVITIGIKINY